MQTTRRDVIKQGVLALSVVAGSQILPITLTPSAMAQKGLRKERWMAPSRITLLQSYIFVAREKGYFADEGLDIDLQQSAGTATSMTQVAAGTAMFGQGAPITTCAPIANEGLNVVSIGQLAYQGFFELASLPNKPLKHPSDWQGKTIGVMSVGGSTDNLLDAMSISQGLDPKNVRKVVTGLGPGGVAFLQRGEVDGFFVFYETKVGLELQGVKLNYLPTDTYAKLPGEAAIVSTKVAEDPAAEKTLVGFLRASRRAVEFINDKKNDDEVMKYLRKYNPVEGSEVEKGKLILELVRGYMAPPAGTPRIVCNDGQWKSAIELLERVDIIKNKGLPSDKYYTNKFAMQAKA